jgi:uncharacterized glyoxalase superfamily protein PhnB
MTETLQGISLGASLTVAKLAEAAAWYVRTLGFVEERRHERDGKAFAISLRGGAVRMLLTQDNGAKGADRVKGEGLSLLITTSQDIDTLAEQVRASGGVLDTEPASMPNGMRMFRLRDPDGFRLTISSG